MGLVWSDEETQYLRDHYLTHNDEQIGKALGRTKLSVTKTREKYKLYKRRKNDQPRKIVSPTKVQPPETLFEVNKKLIIDWHRLHGDKSYGDAPVDYHRILRDYRRAA
jgi:hypothetical protein